MIAVILFMSLLSFVMMGVDKRRAVTGAWRIPERTLILLAAAAGAPGVIAGMLVFRHKTRHLVFRLGVPLILVAQIILAAGLRGLF